MVGISLLLISTSYFHNNMFVFDVVMFLFLFAWLVACCLLNKKWREPDGARVLLLFDQYENRWDIVIA